MSETARLKIFHNEFVVKFVGLVWTIKRRRKLVENASWKPSRWLRRSAIVSDERTTGRCIKWPKNSICRVLCLEPLLTEAMQKQKVHGLRLRKPKESKNADNSLIGTLVMTSSFPTRKYVCCKRPITHYEQNDRGYSSLMRNIPQEKLAVEWYQSVSTIMIWGTISKEGKLLLLFIDTRVKIDQNYFIKHMLQDNLLQLVWRRLFLLPRRLCARHLIDRHALKSGKPKT
jgi:hypothetical protein